MSYDAKPRRHAPGYVVIAVSCGICAFLVLTGAVLNVIEGWYR